VAALGTVPASGASGPETVSMYSDNELPVAKKASPISFEEARSLTFAVERRDDAVRTYVATMRHLYRTGKLTRNLSVHDLDRALWERDSWVNDLDALNLACSAINIIVATTAGRAPLITAEPSFIAPETQQAADAVGALVRQFLEEDDTLTTTRRCGLDASVSGNGFVHIEWLLRVEEMDDDAHKAALASAVQEYSRLAVEAGDDPTPPEGIAEAVPRQQILVNRPTARYVSPIDVVLPGHISEVSETPWYAIRTIVLKDDLRTNTLYDKEAVEACGAERQDSDDPARRRDSSPADEGSSRAEVVTLYTFYDRLAHRVIVFAKNGGKPLYDGANPNNFHDSCLVHLRAYRDGEHVMGFGDLELIAGLMDKLNLVVRQQLDNLERQGQVFVAREELFSEEDRMALEMARPGDVVTVHGLEPGVRLGDVIEAFPVQALSADVYQARQQLADDIVKVLGLSDFQVGGMGPSRMSGTAAAVADGIATLRAQQRLEAYESFYARIANLFWQFCKQHLTEEQAVKIVGPDGSLYQETVAADELSNDYFIRVKTGSMAAVNPATRAQRGGELLNLSDRLEQVGYDADTLRRYALREMGVDPELMGVRRQPPQQPAPEMAPPAGPQMPPGMPPEMGVPPEMMGADPGYGPEMAPQDQMMAMGGPPLPGDDGQFAF
jgi:hypothetical protein